MKNKGTILNNETLKTSLQHYKNNANATTSNEILQEIMKSTFIIPFIYNTTETERKNIEKDPTLAENTPKKYILIQDTKGNLFHPIFTDNEEFEKLNPTLNKMILEFPEYLKLLFSEEENFTGIMINPKTHQFFLPKEILINLTRIIQ
jgi:hypothetical protein